MHSETFGFASAGRLPGLAGSGLLRRIVDRVRSFAVTYELDEHLARDIGSQRYTVPVFGTARGDGR